MTIRKARLMIALILLAGGTLAQEHIPAKPAGEAMCQAVSGLGVPSPFPICEEREDRGGVNPTQPDTPHTKLYWSSVAFVAAGSAFDAATSWGRPEANPLMRSRDGRFGARAAGLHVVYVVGVVVAQRRCFRRHRRAMAVANFAAGGLLFGFGAANLARR